MDAIVPECTRVGGIGSMPADQSLFWDFVSFRVLISPAVLVVFYYMGALVVPLLIFVFARGSARAAKRMLDGQTVAQLQDAVRISRKSGVRLLLLSLLAFLMLELFWRMLFEFLIAYFQMHNALVGAAGG